MKKSKQKQKALFPEYQFRDLEHALEVWISQLKTDVETTQETDDREKEFGRRGVHILYREPPTQIQWDSKAVDALLYNLINKHKDPYVARMFDHVTSQHSNFPAELGPVTTLEMFCVVYRKGIIYKDQIKTDGELAEMFKECPFDLRRELQEFAKKLNATFYN